MQTDGSEPNKLLVVTADIARPRVAAAESVAAWVEQGKSAFISKPSKTLLHPGEVRRTAGKARAPAPWRRPEGAGEVAPGPRAAAV